MYRNTEYTRIKAPAGRYVYSKHGRTNPKPQRGGMFIEHRQTNFPSPKYPVGCPSILGSLSLAPYITFWVFRHVPHRIDARYIEKVPCVRIYKLKLLYIEDIENPSTSY